MRCVVLGAGGFIGNHLVDRLKDEGHYVIGVDLKEPEFGHTTASLFEVADLRDPKAAERYMNEADEVYNLAALMGGAGFIFTGQNDFQVMQDNTRINLNVSANAHRCGRVFFSSSACVYPDYNQKDPDNPICHEMSAYPASPDSEYGWEKLYAERLYQVAANQQLVNANVRIARFHNIYGPMGTWTGGKEKAPAAICRKIAMVKGREGTIEVWGDGKQTRSFLYIDDCIDGIIKLMRSDVKKPLNIGSEEMVSINKMVSMVSEAAGKKIEIKHIDGPQGVRGRCSDNTWSGALLGWYPETTLSEGLAKTYKWIEGQILGNV
jgi:GDP-D-mannose 3',5'-epimerase